MRRLARPGVSKNVREMFFKKHAIYVIIFIAIWVIQLSNNYFVLTHPYSDNYTIIESFLNPMKHSSPILGKSDHKDRKEAQEFSET